MPAMIDPAPTSARRASMACVLVLAASALLVACGDDGDDGRGGSGPSSTTSSSSTSTQAASTSSTAGGGGGGGTGGGGGAGGGAGGTGGGGVGGSGGGVDVCAPADDVADELTLEIDVVAGDGLYECSLVDGFQDGATLELGLFCITDGGIANVTLRYTPEPALAEPIVVPDEVLTLADLSSDPDEPPVSEGYVLRGQDGRLLLAWIAGSSSRPPLAADDWAEPLSITEVDGLCDADENGDEHRALDVALGDEAPVRVHSDTVATIGGYQVRVSDNRYDADIAGGFNSLYRYAIVAPAGGAGTCPAVVQSAAECVGACDAVYEDPSTGGIACTVACDPEAGCGAASDQSCVQTDAGGYVCLPSCGDGLACPDGFLCDLDLTICVPD